MCRTLEENKFANKTKNWIWGGKTLKKETFYLDNVTDDEKWYEKVSKNIKTGIERLL